MIDKIIRVTSILQDELKFVKSLKSEQCPEQDMTIENLEKAIKILEEVISIQDNKCSITSCLYNSENTCHYRNDIIWKNTISEIDKCPFIPENRR